jgi:hypothetical protein
MISTFIQINKDGYITQFLKLVTTCPALQMFRLQNFTLKEHINHDLNIHITVNNFSLIEIWDKYSKFNTNCKTRTNLEQTIFLRNSDSICTCIGDVAGYCHMTEWLQTGFGLIFGFIELLQNVTASNYSTITNSNTLLIWPQSRPHSKQHFQHYFHCCMRATA